MSLFEAPVRVTSLRSLELETVPDPAPAVEYDTNSTISPAKQASARVMFDPSVAVNSAPDSLTPLRNTSR